MFAALTIARFREAVIKAGLDRVASWKSPDEVEPTSLPLAKAIEKVLGSMQTILQKTKVIRDKRLESLSGELGVSEMEKGSDKRAHLRATKAAEVTVVRCLADLSDPKVEYKAEAVEADRQEYT